MTDVDRWQRYRDALRWLERRHCYLAAEVMELGRPVWVESTDTAYVTILDGELVFGFNRDWFDQLNWRELITVMVHEAGHVTHRHIDARQGVPDPSRAHLYNLACDAVVNDRITAYNPQLQLPEGAVTGRRLIGRDTLGLTAEQVFALLQEALTLTVLPPATSAADGSILRVAEGSQPDRVTPETVWAITTLDDHSFWECEDLTNSQRCPRRAELDQRLAEIVQRYAVGDRWGEEAAALVRAAPEQKTRFDLEGLLWRKIGWKLAVETRWVPPPRRLAAFYPEVLLPSYPPRSFRRVLLALDASGSISQEVLGVFVSLSRRRWPECQVLAVSFDTQVYPFAPAQRNACPRGGGGTSFQAVEAYALSLEHYPDLIIVFTDGQAPRPRLRHPRRWIWCLSCATPPSALRGLGECIALPLSHLQTRHQ